MSEENKALIRRIFDEVLNKGNLDKVGEFVATNYIEHDFLPEQITGPAGLKERVSTLRHGFPDLHYSIEDLLSTEANKVVGRWTMRGTHRGEFMGIRPTGKSVAMTGIAIWRIADGKVVERWANYDTLGMLQQLGVIPRPGDRIMSGWRLFPWLFPRGG